jgi:hypothetical protein
MFGWLLQLGVNGNGQNGHIETITLVNCVLVALTHIYAGNYVVVRRARLQSWSVFSEPDRLWKTEARCAKILVSCIYR